MKEMLPEATKSGCIVALIPPTSKMASIQLCLTLPQYAHYQSTSAAKTSPVL